MSLLRSVVDGITVMLGRLKRHRRYARPLAGDELKVNLGCGLAVCPGWLNIDGSLNALIASWPQAFHSIFYRLSGASAYYGEADYCALLREHRFIHHDLAYGIPLEDESAVAVYSSHFLEHLYKPEAEFLLREAYRVLKPGGLLRICVPDLEYALSLYAKGEKEKMLLNYFFVEDKGSQYARHKYMYDYAMLQAALEGVGFRDVRRCAYRTGRVPDLDKLDNRPEETLFVEAAK